MFDKATKLAEEMLEHIQTLQTELHIERKEAKEWRDLAIEMHDAYKLNVERLERTQSELVKYQRRIAELKEELYQAKNSQKVAQNSISQDDLKRIRRYVHPDCTQKDTGDLFRLINGMIK